MDDLKSFFARNPELGNFFRNHRGKIGSFGVTSLGFIIGGTYHLGKKIQQTESSKQENSQSLTKLGELSSDVSSIKPMIQDLTHSIRELPKELEKYTRDRIKDHEEKETSHYYLVSSLSTIIICLTIFACR
jgi:polyhydroxyalkanoate synthesis regulator phasin